MSVVAPAAPPAPFPPIEPWQSGWLEVGNGHALYFEQCGNRDGIPLVVLHGGPGSSCSPRMRQMFDPARFRIVLFDQRGCGRSTPPGECAHNTTGDLIADIERLRQHLDVARWLMVGGSWGAALAVAYAAAHRSECLGLVLRGVFLTGEPDLAWFFGGAAEHAPDAWARLAQASGQTSSAAIRAWLIESVLGDNRARAVQAVQHWMAWESALDSGTALPTLELDEAAAAHVLSKYRIQAHYLRHACFMGEDILLRRAALLADLPVAILHGDRDHVCRADNAIRLQQAIPGSRLEIVATAGHNPFEAPMLDALSRALSCFAANGDFSGWGRRDEA